LKVLAAQADARWAAKPSLLDKPGHARGQALPALGGINSSMASPMREPAKRETEVPQEVGWDGEVRSGSAARLKDVEDAARKEREAQGEKPTTQEPDHEKHYFNERTDGTRIRQKKVKEDPWKQHRGAPSENWQPEAWSPGVATKR
jgi:NADH dehydrogenase [ubiquinone] 1 alpha subcomplex assembly factor 2